MNDILHEFERLGRTYSDRTFLYLQGEEANRRYTFCQLNLVAATLARTFAKRGAIPGTTVACNLYNGPELVITVLAALYGGFNLALLNPRFTVEERAAALAQLDVAIPVLEERDYSRLVLENLGIRLREVAKQSSARVDMARTALNLDEFIEARLEAFDPAKSGIVLFDADGVAVHLPWTRLTASALDANQQLQVSETSVWQVVIPLCHIDGFQIIVRSLMNANPVLIYEYYTVQRVLNDVLPFKASHITVVSQILEDLVLADHDAVLCQYHCILISGEQPPVEVLRRANRAGARVRTAHAKEGADLIINGHELGLDCSYDELYLDNIANN